MNIDLRSIEISIENRDSIGRPRAVFIAGGPRQQHDLVCDLRSRCPDLLTVNEIAIGNLLREGFDTGRVEPGIRLRETEAALIFARDQPRNPACFLVRRPFYDNGMGSK